MNLEKFCSNQSVRLSDQRRQAEKLARDFRVLGDRVQHLMDRKWEEMSREEYDILKRMKDDCRRMTQARVGAERRNS